MMKKLKLSLVICAFLAANQASAAEDVGAVTFKVFAHYQYDATSGQDRDSEFELKRSYLGYAHTFDDAFSAKVLVDVGREDGGEFEAFLKNAYLQWKGFTPKVDLLFGLHGMNQFSYQEKFWGHRYLFKSFMDQNKFGSSADLGVTAKVKASSRVKLNLTLANGDGYKKRQDDYGEHKVAAGAEIKLTDSLSSYLYVDSMDVKDAESQETVAFFLGYRRDAFKLGGEYNYQTAHKGTRGKDLTGISIYSSYAFSDQWEGFVRWDDLSSEKNSNYGPKETNDGEKTIVGLQYTPRKGVNIAFDYQSFSHDQPGNSDIKQYCMHLEYKI